MICRIDQEDGCPVYSRGTYDVTAEVTLTFRVCVTTGDPDDCHDDIMDAVRDTVYLSDDEFDADYDIVCVEEV